MQVVVEVKSGQNEFKIRPMSDIDPYADKFRPARLPFEIA